MAYLGLVPGEHSSGDSIRPRGITKADNVSLRALLFEAARCYHLPARVAAYSRAKRLVGIPQKFKDIAWKAQVRLSGRYRRLLARGKKRQVAVTAVARELLGFIWAIGVSANIG
jgi:transposase